MAKKHFYEFEAIMKRLEEETNDTGRNVIHINTIQRLLRDTPTIEAVPVVHGEWINAYLYNKPMFAYGICSQCGFIKHDISDTLNFCPDCGADMRKKVE